MTCCRCNAPLDGNPGSRTLALTVHDTKDRASVVCSRCWVENKNTKPIARPNKN